MENMLPTMSTLSMANNNTQNSKPPSSRSTSYGALGLENDDNFFDGILAVDHQSMQSGSDSHLFCPNSKGTNFPMKRALTSQQLWNETGSPGSSSSCKRFHGDLNSGSSNAEDNDSFVSLLSQFPQNATFQPNAIHGSVGNGAQRQQQFQLPGINWNWSIMIFWFSLDYTHLMKKCHTIIFSIMLLLVFFTCNHNMQKIRRYQALDICYMYDYKTWSLQIVLDWILYNLVIKYLT